MTTPLSRRLVLRRAAFLAAGTVVGTSTALLSRPGAARGPGAREAPRVGAQGAGARQARPERRPVAQRMGDGEDRGRSRAHLRRPVPGIPVDGVQVRMGDVETVLVHVIRRFHYEIDELRRDDVTGWRHPSKVRKGMAESNQASGTAVQVRPGSYPSRCEAATSRSSWRWSGTSSPSARAWFAGAATTSTRTKRCSTSTSSPATAGCQELGGRSPTETGLPAGPLVPAPPDDQALAE